MEVGGRQTTVDAAGMRAQNAGLLLNLIWRERQISRADIARNTGLSASTVSAIVGDLEETGLVRDVGTGISRGGRRPTLLGFCDDAFAIVGVEIGGSHVTVVLTDLRDQIRVFRTGAFPARDQPEGALALVRSFIDDCLRTERVPRGRVLGIGVAVPSPVRSEAPGRMFPLVVPAWRDYDILEYLTAAYDVPVLIENDANLGALAEQWWGAGRDGDDLSYVKIASGIGAGHIIHGRLYRGAGGTAGEIGHLVVDPTGPKCLCGLRGCLTVLIGAYAITGRARELLGVNKERVSSLDDVVQLVRAGDPVAVQVLDDVGRYLGIAVAGIMNTLNPAVVVLGGEITAVGDRLLDAVRAAVRERAFPSCATETRIVTSTLGDHAIAVGAATLVLQTALSDRSFFPEPRKARAVP